MTGDLSGGDLSRLRRLNALAVIGVLRGEPALTLTEVVRRTGLSRASTEDVVRELLERGWMIEAEPTAGTVGRPARRYRFRADTGAEIERAIRQVLAEYDLAWEPVSEPDTKVFRVAGRAQSLARP